MMTLYRGSVKDLVGPVPVGEHSAVVFEYTDAYSVFDWGRMPDLLTGKGEALAVMAAEIFERIERPEVWKEFSKTQDALLLRKGNRFGALFNEIGEELQSKGLRTHYLGVIEKSPLQGTVEPKRTSQIKAPVRRLVVKQVSVVKPTLTTVLGRAVPDYSPTRNSPFPKLVPLEVVFRMGAPEGSSILDRVAKDPFYLASIGYSDLAVSQGARWDFPLLELFTKLESSDRLISFSESLAISGLSAPQLQEVMLKSIWVAGLLRYWFSKLGLDLADGKLEWGVGADGSCFLVDAIGPDELRVLKDGMQLSKEFLRLYYRKTRWYETVEKAKVHAKKLGSMEWKRWVPEAPPALPHAYHELAIQVYLSLANDLLGRNWFPQAWGTDRVVEGLKNLAAGDSR
jgi:phosphoribosylaminoimidazole-succinocarboxamide synthase